MILARLQCLPWSTQAYITNKFLNPLAVKVETKIINTIMNATIKV